MGTWWDKKKAQAPKRQFETFDLLEEGNLNYFAGAVSVARGGQIEVACNSKYREFFSCAICLLSINRKKTLICLHSS